MGFGVITLIASNCFLLRYAACETPSAPIIRLDLHSLRIKGHSYPSQDHVTKWLGNHHPSGDATSMFCTDSVFPNDIFCDAGPLRNDDTHTEIYGMDLEFSLPSDSKSVCTMEFELRPYSAPYHLRYSKTWCLPSKGMMQSPLPYRVAELKTVIVKTREPDNMWSNCQQVYKKAGSMRNPMRNFYPPIKFSYVRSACVSPIIHEMNNKEVVGEAEKKKMMYDGGRGRPETF